MLVKARTAQNAINHPAQVPYRTAPFLGTVEATHNDRMTCDVRIGPRKSDGTGGYVFRNIPVVTNAGLTADEEVFGTVDLPGVGTLVLILPVQDYNESYVILGNLVPYLYSKFQKSQTPAVSGNKQFAQKLLEPLTSLYRKIFKGGTSVEVLEDGTIQIETPSGTYAQIDEAGGVITVEDQHTNNVTIDSNGVTLTDANGNTVTLDSAGVNVSDANGNTIEMGTASVVINGGNLEVLQ